MSVAIQTTETTVTLDSPIEVKSKNSLPVPFVIIVGIFFLFFAYLVGGIVEFSLAGDIIEQRMAADQIAISSAGYDLSDMKPQP